MLAQPAPWVAEAGARGDGAIVLFMQLGSDVNQGRLPLPGADFPYWLPQDGSSQFAVLGADYIAANGSSASVVAQGLVLRNQRNVVWQQSKRSVGVVLGRLAASATTRKVQPSLATVAAGGSVDFTLESMTGGRWSATNTYRSSASGSISDKGHYTSTQSSAFAKQTQLVVVEGGAVGSEPTGAALVVESLDAIQGYPRVVTWQPNQPAIQMRAAGGNGAALKWKTLGEDWGTLSAGEGAENTFTPHPPEEFIPPIRLQQIEVTDGKSTTQATAVIVVWPASRIVSPDYVRREQAVGEIAFSVRSSLGGPEAARNGYTWEVFGDGTIDPDTGVYTPPAVSTRACSVVMALKDDEHAGYAIIEHGVRAARSSPTSSWTGLNKFYLQAGSGGKAYANGLQQIEILVTLETSVPDGEPYDKVSPEDLNTLKFYAKGGSEVPFLEDYLTGFEPPADTLEAGIWKASRRHNPRFSMMPGPGAARSAEPRNEEATVYKRYYLQTTSVLEQEFYAEFTRIADGTRWNSLEESDQNGVVKLQGVERPKVALEAYTLVPTRVDQDPNGQIIGGDTFSYMDWTLDYYRLNLVRSGVRIPFVDVIIGADDITSAVRWESEQFDEGGVSYTGFALGGSAAFTKLSVSGLLKRLNANRERGLKEAFITDKGPAEGEFLVCLARESDFVYLHEKDTLEEQVIPPQLDRPFKFLLIDKEGNRHYLQFGFEVSESRRNVLLLELQAGN